MRAVLRPGSAIALPVIVWSAAAVLLVDALVRAGVSGLRVVPVLATASVLVWVLLWRPRTIVGDDDVEVRNVLRTHRIGYGAISAVRIGAMVRLDARGEDGTTRTLTAWNAPGVGRDRPGRGGGPTRRLAEDQARSPSAVVRERWEAWHDAHDARKDAGAPTAAVDPATMWSTRWNLLELAVVLAVALAVIATSNA